MDNSWLKFVTTRGLEVSIHPPKYFQKLESLEAAVVGRLQVEKRVSLFVQA